MADFFGKGIGVAAGFDLGAAAPLDTRTVVSNMEELQAHIDGGRTYEGMMVYVESEGKMYIIGAKPEGQDKPTVEEFGFNQDKFDEGIADVEQGVEDLKAADEEIKGRLNTLEGLVVGGEGEGISAILGDVADLKTKATELETRDGELQGAIEAVEGDVETLKGNVTDLQAKDEELQGAIEAAQTTATQGVQDAATAQAAAEAAQGEVDALEVRVGTLEAINHEAYIAADEQVLASAKEHAQGLADAEKERAEGVEAELAGRLDIVEAIAHHSHENKEVLDGITAEKVAAWDGAEQAAKDYADQQITALVDSAPEAMNTLGELAQAIKDHGDVYTAYVAEVSEDLEGKVDKVEGSRLVSEEEIAAFEAKADMSDVQAAQEAAEKVATDGDAALQAQINALKGETEGSIAEQIGAAKEELQGKIDEVAGDVQAAQQAADDAQADATQALADAATADGKAVAAQGTADQAVQDAATAQAAAEAAQTTANQGVQDAATAQAAAEAAQGEVDALEEVVGAPAVDDKEATGLFAQIAALKAKDNAIDERDTAQEVRLAVIEEMMGLGGEGDTSALDQFAQDIAGLKSAVGAQAQGEDAATGLFAEIAALKARDGELQGAIDTEAQRAKDAEKANADDIDALEGRMDNAETAISQAQVDIQGLQDTINANAEADGALKGRMDALEGVVGKAAVEGEEPQVATGLFAEIAALKEADAALAAKDAELAAAIGAPAAEGQAATGVYAHIKSLHDGVSSTFATIKAEIKEDGKLYTSVAGTELKTVTDVPVMNEEDIQSVLGNILGQQEEEQPQE